MFNPLFRAHRPTLRGGARRITASGDLQGNANYCGRARERERENIPAIPFQENGKVRSNKH